MNVFEAVKQSVTTRQAAEHYGIHVGRNGMACCPFHNDKTPSMKLDRRYHCFGCGADGDVIDFTAALYGLGKKEAAVQYAVKKDRSSSPPKYLIFFKGRDADALTAAFTEYTGKKVKKAEKTERPSVLAKLNQFKELVKNAVVDRTKRKELER